MAAPIMRYFEYVHLPENLQKVSIPVAELALKMDESLPDGPEKSAGLRKLLEAKDCFVRAALDIPKDTGGYREVDSLGSRIRKGNSK